MSLVSSRQKDALVDLPARKGDHATLLYSEADWTFDTLRNSYNAIERIAEEELKLDVYPNRIEVITSEQMLDVYTSHGMPLIYKLKSVHQLPHGGKQRHDAGVGNCARRFRA